MSIFIQNIRQAFQVILKPAKFRTKLIAIATSQRINTYYILIVPFILLDPIIIAFTYFLIDGWKVAFLAFLILLFSDIILGIFLIYGISYFLKAAHVYTKVFIYSLGFALFWIFFGQFVQTILVLFLGILGRFIGGWPLKLGAIWLADVCIKEIIYELVPLEIPKMRNLANNITIFLVITALVVPFVTERLIEQMARNVF